MILANVAAAETLEAAHVAADLPRPRRAEPGKARRALNEFLGTLGVKLAKSERMRPSHFNKVLAAR